MSSEPAVRVRGLAKRYPSARGRRAQTIRDRLARLVGPAGDEAWAWALEDVSFDVREGRSLGIVGANGAGKSTLLRVLARITEPTRGRVELRGRVASLLDVGAGFHSELTGRENVFLNGAVLGMSRREIAARFDAIVAFAELDGSIDAPVKTYSNGMHLRLAFAVAAHLDSDVLLVDEVLAVGDARFQRRCLARMSEVMRDGRSVVLVSHSLEIVRRICDDAVWLDRGRIRADGSAGDVVDAYLGESLGHAASVALTPPEPLDPDGAVRLRGFELRDDAGAPRARFALDEAITIAIALDGSAEELRIGVALLATTLEDVAGATAPWGVAQDGVVRCRILPGSLAVGEYAIEVVAFSSADPSRTLRSSRALPFAVVPSSAPGPGAPRAGLVTLATRWSYDEEPA